MSSSQTRDGTKDSSEELRSKTSEQSDIETEKTDGVSSHPSTPLEPSVDNEKLESKDHDKTTAPDPDTDDAAEEDTALYPSGMRLVFLVASLCLTVFLFALDGTILATVLPQITDQFGTIDDIAWYSAAFFLTTCAFQLPYGRAYTLLNTKWTYQVSVVIFLVGSAVCGATPTSIGLIIGRAIAGIGGAGVIGGVFIIISKSIPLRKRSMYAGFVGASLSISSVIGPVIGGAFTTHASWRWYVQKACCRATSVLTYARCFYINLPVGAVVLVFVYFCLPEIGHTSEDFKGLSVWQKFLKFDPFGTVVLMASIICLILALQWGGASGNWGDGRVVATLVVFAITLVGWAVMQYMRGEEATLPWSVAKQRTVAGSTAYALLGSAAFTMVVYWLPIW